MDISMANKIYIIVDSLLYELSGITKVGMVGDIKDCNERFKTDLLSMNYGTAKKFCKVWFDNLKNKPYMNNEGRKAIKEAYNKICNIRK